MFGSLKQVPLFSPIAEQMENVKKKQNKKRQEDKKKVGHQLF